MNERSTRRQKELLDFVTQFISEHGYGPSYREVMTALGYKSVSTVAVHIDGLVAKGYVRKRTRSARSLEVVTDNYTGKAVPSKETSREKWLTHEIDQRFDAYRRTPTQLLLDELYVLVGTLKILGFTTAYEKARERLRKV